MSSVLCLFPEHQRGLSQQEYKKAVDGYSSSFFSQRVENNLSLDMAYETHCAVLRKALTQEKIDPIRIRVYVEKALDMVIFLEYMYREYMVINDKVLSLRRDRQLYQKWLNGKSDNSEENEGNDDAISSFSLMKVISRVTIGSNWYRLFLLRLRRLMVVAKAASETIPDQRNWIQFMEEVTANFVRYFAWIFFLPRLSANLTVFSRHVIPCFTRRKENELPFTARLIAHFQRQWFDIFNDAPWFSGGVVICFMLVGSLAPIALYVGIALQVYDVFLAMIRIHVEIGRLQNIEKEYLTKWKQSDVNEKPYWNESLAQIRYRIQSENKRLHILLANNMVLAIAIMLALPTIAVHPIIPIIGALMAVITTIVTFTLISRHVAQQPKVSISEQLLNAVTPPPSSQPPAEDGVTSSYTVKL